MERENKVSREMTITKSYRRRSPSCETINKTGATLRNASTTAGSKWVPRPVEMKLIT